MLPPRDALAPFDRSKVLRGSHNVRDLGGLTTVDGRVVRAGRIFRSDYPAFAELDEGAAVRELGLRTVVDLRRGIEASHECVTWEDHRVAYYRCPFSAGGETSWHARYSAYLTHRPETVVLAVDHVIETAGHPVLFHCAAGKDRTGVLACLVLGLLGVERAQIVADYVLSEVGLGPILERLSAAGPYAEMLAGDTLADQLPRAQSMHGLLDWLEERGGATGWLRARGLADGKIDAFREALLK